MAGGRFGSLVGATVIAVENFDVEYTTRYRHRSERESAMSGGVAKEQVLLRQEKDGSLEDL